MQSSDPNRIQTNLSERIIPRNEPEIMRAKGRLHAAWCNDNRSKPYKDPLQALKLAEQAYEAHELPYKAGIDKLREYPPDRFTWFCEETGDAKECVKVRDFKTGRIVVWPHWYG
jgi:hypothetical protein